MPFVWICDKKLFIALAVLFFIFSYLNKLDQDMISKTSILQNITK